MNTINIKNAFDNDSGIIDAIVNITDIRYSNLDNQWNDYDISNLYTTGIRGFINNQLKNKTLYPDWDMIADGSGAARWYCDTKRNHTFMVRFDIVKVLRRAK